MARDRIFRCWGWLAYEVMMETANILAEAAIRRGACDWPAALALYGRVHEHRPGDAAVVHNLALCAHALGDDRAALSHAAAALRRSPGLWQSHALAARISRRRGDIAAANVGYHAVLDIDAGNGTARLGLADLALNEYGDATAARRLVAPLSGDPDHGADAELTGLMAALYDRGGLSARALTRELIGFADRSLRLPRRAPAAPVSRTRRRVGVVSPLLSATPVYFLGYSALRALSNTSDLVFFNRGARRDWATERFHAIAAEWHEAAELDGPALASRLAAADLDILIDCGGWSDPAGLLALSAKPAPVQWTWVGGQSATTGLDSFDAWLGDEWHNPPMLAGLYSEPVVRLAGGYVDYTPPPCLGAVAGRAGNRGGVALAGNPVKIGKAMLQHWPAGLSRVSLLDRRYVHAATRDRVVALLARAGVGVDAVIIPDGHAEYLEALSRFDAIVDTRPYSTGLTAVEAAALGVSVISAGPPGDLFSERHQLSHARTGGRNSALAGQLAAMVAAA